jgi:16S rRNA (guanine527-N7)-methyltransferase
MRIINMEKDLFIEMMTSSLKEMQIDYCQDYIDKLWAYLLFLRQENQKYNLTGIDNPRQIVTKHLLDSLSLLEVVKLLNGSMIDVGSGAGFPGIVLKIFFPSLNLVLLDSLARRVSFLEKVIERLSLSGIKAIHGRAEDLGQDLNYRDRFDWVVSRAVSPLNTLSEFTLPFAKKGGHIILYKGPDYINELNQGKRAVLLLGGEVESIRRVQVSNLNGERFIVFLRKVRETPARYPRKAGIPKKRPL